MKKLTLALALAATLTSNGVFAQSAPKMGGMTGSGAQAGTYTSYDNFAWGIGLGALAVIGVVVGLSAGAGASSPSTFSH